jgi:hypothetical protein
VFNNRQIGKIYSITRIHFNLRFTVTNSLFPLIWPIYNIHFTIFSFSAATPLPIHSAGLLSALHPMEWEWEKTSAAATAKPNGQQPGGSDGANGTSLFRAVGCPVEMNEAN